MNKFTTWYFKNYIKITWFVIGLLFAAGVESFGVGNYVWAVFSLSCPSGFLFLHKRNCNGSFSGYVARTAQARDHR